MPANLLDSGGCEKLFNGNTKGEPTQQGEWIVNGWKPTPVTGYVNITASIAVNIVGSSVNSLQDGKGNLLNYVSHT